MVHQPSGGFQGQATDILIHARETEKLKRRLNEIYVQHTGRTLDEVEQALERDRFMSPEEAKDWGLIDEILVARGKAEPEKKSSPTAANAGCFGDCDGLIALVTWCRNA